MRKKKKSEKEREREWNLVPSYNLSGTTTTTTTTKTKRKKRKGLRLKNSNNCRICEMNKNNKGINCFLNILRSLIPFLFPKRKKNFFLKFQKEGEQVEFGVCEPFLFVVTFLSTWML